MDWLKILRTKSYSDRSLHVQWYTREDDNVDSDILSNQMCLLPKNRQAWNNYDIRTVDKVILCCSDVLRNYYEDSRMKTYTQALKNAYPETEVEDIDEIKREVENIVNQYDGKDGFHHVLTELAFLEIRHRQQGKKHGIIPIVLNGDGIRYFSFFSDGVPVWLHRQENSKSIIHESQASHRLFFNLLRRIYDGLEAELTSFENCYNECVNTLIGSTSLSPEEIEHMISKNIHSAFDRVIRDKAAGIRTGRSTNVANEKSWLTFCVGRDIGNFNVTFDLTGIPKTERFVGRENELVLIEKRLMPGERSNRRKICVIDGVGGMGKTQLAIEYARRHNSDYTAFFWLNGKTEETLLQSILQLASRIAGKEVRDVKELEERRAEVKEVLTWFTQPRNTQWLLIYDNIDQTSYGDNVREAHLDSPSIYNIEDYFPRCDTGTIIVTTRLQRLSELGRESIHLRELNDQDSLLMLEEYAGRSFTRNGSLSSSVSEFDIEEWDPG